MPYRRLPNTDAARLKALRKAFEKGKEIPPFKLAFSQHTFQRVQSFLPSYEKAMYETKQAYSNQVQRNKDYQKTLKKAKLYISHFIQVINMSIARGDLPNNERALFGMKEEMNKLPLLSSESEVIKWGEKLIHGEILRKSKGLSPITNPTIALVMVQYEQFLDSYKFQKTLQKNYQRAQEHIAGLRKEADDIILNVWNEVEAKFSSFSEEVKRQKAEEYGVAYVFRKNELKKLKLKETEQEK
ncbi:MAG: hypothetical protein JW894_07830 [Bacteroidales bacterium]|nr:hypothetical protein [Bacteroidales bacterium]